MDKDLKSDYLSASSIIAFLKSFLSHTYLVKLGSVSICLVAVLALKKKYICYLAWRRDRIKSFNTNPLLLKYDFNMYSTFINNK